MQKLPLCFPWEMLVPWRPDQEPSTDLLRFQSELLTLISKDKKKNHLVKH